jgi:hypothetical protein
MSKNLSKIREPLWNRPVCGDNTEPYRNRQEARRAYMQDSKAEERGERVASAEYLEEAFEYGGHPLEEDRFDQFD